MKRLFTKNELEQIEYEAKFKLLAFDENDEVKVVDKAPKVEGLEHSKLL